MIFRISQIALCFGLLGIGLSAVAEEVGQAADWAARRAQIQVMRDRADSIRTESELVYVQQERRCYEDVLVNRCREAARRADVAERQRARQLEIDAKQQELAVRREEKAQRERDDAVAAPERIFNTRQRIQETEGKRNQQDLDRESLTERKVREAEDGSARVAREDKARAERQVDHQRRLQEKIEKSQKNAERVDKKNREEAQRRAASLVQPE